MAGENKNITFQNNTAGPNYYQHALALAQNQDGAGTVAAMAQQGAAAMAKLGPEGEQWARDLVADPAAAMARMEKMGGAREIERKLMMGQAVGRNASVQELQGLGLQYEGAGAYKDIGAGALAQNQMSGVAGLDEVMQFRKDIRKDSSGWDVRKGFMRAALVAADTAANDPDPVARGAADFALIQAMGKMIDPGSVVRNEEGKLIVQSGDSESAAFVHSIARWFGKTGILSDTARLKLLDQINAQWAGAMTEQQERVDVFRTGKAQRVGLTGRLLEMSVPSEVDPMSPGYSDMMIDTSIFAGRSKESAADEADMGAVLKDEDGDQHKKVPRPKSKKFPKGYEMIEWPQPGVKGD